METILAMNVIYVLFSSVDIIEFVSLYYSTSDLFHLPLPRIPSARLTLFFVKYCDNTLYDCVIWVLQFMHCSIGTGAVMYHGETLSDSDNKIVTSKSKLLWECSHSYIIILNPIKGFWARAYSCYLTIERGAAFAILLNVCPTLKYVALNRSVRLFV